MTNVLDNLIGENSITRLKNALLRHKMLLLAAFTFLIGYWPLISIWRKEYWNNIDGYYSHGAIVPILAALMINENRSRIAGVKSSRSWIGLILLLAGVPIYILGMLVKLQFLCGTAFLLSAFGLTIAILGVQIAKVVAIPILFLTTMIPFADYVLDTLTLRFQVISTKMAAISFTLLGHSVQQAGNTILSDGLPGPLQIGIACSGLKLLVTLIMCCWFLMYMIEGPRYKKAIVLAMALPLSIFCNTLRIVMIGLVGFHTYSSTAVESFHDWSGYITLVICTVLVFGVIRLFGMKYFKTFTPSESEQSYVPPPMSVINYRLIGIFTVIILALGAAGGWRANALLNLPTGHLNRANIPIAFDRWVGHDIELDEQTKQILAKGDHMSRSYTSSFGDTEPVYVFITAGFDTRAFHNPLMCLSGSGNTVEHSQLVELTFDNPKHIAVNAQKLKVTSDSGSSVMVYWYMRKQESWPDTQTVQLLIKKETFMDALNAMRNPFNMQALNTRTGSKQIRWYRFTTNGSDDAAAVKRLDEFIPAFIKNVRDFGE